MLNFNKLPGNRTLPTEYKGFIPLDVEQAVIEEGATEPSYKVLCKGAKYVTIPLSAFPVKAEAPQTTPRKEPKMYSIAIRRTRFAAVLALIFMGVFAAEARSAQDTPWKWLVNLATVATNGAKAWVVDKLDETVQTTGDFIAWGSGAGTAAAADTTLFTEEAEARVTATRTQQTTTVTGDTVRWVGSLTAAAGKTITNAGNFTASSAGTLIVKGDFTGIVLNTGDIIEFTINLQVT